MDRRELIIALENLIIVAEERYDSRRIVDADDVIAMNSISTIRQLIKNLQDVPLRPGGRLGLCDE